MGAVIVQRQRIDDAAAGEGQPGLAGQERDLLRDAEPQTLRGRRSAVRPPAGRECRRPRPGRRRCGLPAFRPRSSVPARTARASRCGRRRRAARSAAATSSAPTASAAASRGTKTRVKPASPASGRSASGFRRPTGRPSTSAAGPVAHRPRQNTGSSVTAPFGVVSCQSTSSASRRCAPVASAADGLAGLGAADMQHVAPGRRATELVIEGHDPMHFGSGEVQRRGDQRLRLQRNAAECRLQRVQDRQRGAFQADDAQR